MASHWVIRPGLGVASSRSVAHLVGEAQGPAWPRGRSTTGSEWPSFLAPGFNPMWEETLVFTVHMPEIALVRFLVWDHDPIGRDFIGQRTLAFSSMMPGGQRGAGGPRLAPLRSACPRPVSSRAPVKRTAPCSRTEEGLPGRAEACSGDRWRT